MLSSLNEVDCMLMGCKERVLPLWVSADIVPADLCGKFGATYFSDIFMSGIFVIFRIEIVNIFLFWNGLLTTGVPTILVPIKYEVHF